MKSCWVSCPDDRPSFTDMRNELENLMEEDELYIDISAGDYYEYSTLARDDMTSEEEQTEASSDNRIDQGFFQPNYFE